MGLRTGGVLASHGVCARYCRGQFRAGMEGGILASWGTEAETGAER